MNTDSKLAEALPPLPEPVVLGVRRLGVHVDLPASDVLVKGYSADQMREYALAAHAELISECDRLRAFKTYVHQRLDAAGIPADPPSPHREHGCRIGGRLDIAINRAGITDEAFKQVLASLVAAVSLLRKGGKKGAPSDNMFNAMLADYEKAIEAGRAALECAALHLHSEKLRALVRKWREASKRFYAAYEKTAPGYFPDFEAKCRSEELKFCADELESIIGSKP